MNKIILERNIEYSHWENLIYIILFLTGIFIGTTFFTKGDTARYFSITSGTLILVCIILVILKKGLIYNNNLGRGYFLFGRLLFYTKINYSDCNTFTMINRNYNQKYERAYRDPNWSYSIKSFELYFKNKERDLIKPIIKCMKEDSSERAKEFLIKNCNLLYID